MKEFISQIYKDKILIKMSADMQDTQILNIAKPLEIFRKRVHNLLEKLLRNHRVNEETALLNPLVMSGLSVYYFSNRYSYI